MTWDQRGGTGGFGGAGDGFAVPPMPPVPPSPPPAPADPLRAVAVALLNLSGLGLGYALVRSWIGMVLSWIATGILLLVALPADPDGVPGGLLIAYLVFLAITAAHGAVRGLRTRLAWPPQSPLALLLGLVLLAAPVGAVVVYGGARDEAVEQMLLDRLGKADRLVRTAKTQSFGTAEADFRTALGTYRDLHDNHPDSRAAARVPRRLTAYYRAVGTPYDQEKYCEAIAPLTYLRTLPDTMGAKRLGSLATWPDDRLATSLYECGADGLDKNEDAAWKDLGDLLSTFPESAQAAKVEPVVRSTVDRAAKALKGDDPCAANERLRTLSTQVTALPGDKAGVADALKKDAAKADRSVQSGTYACGVDQYKDGEFGAAMTTMNDFVTRYKHDKNRARAKKIIIAAEVARAVPAAGKRLPTTASGGGIPVTVKNDSPDEVEILFTGPVTGRFTLKPCKGCTTYSSAISASLSACKDSSKNYPQKTITLPAGTTYFLHKPKGASTASNATDTAKLRYGYAYTECAYVTNGFGLGY